ncbi:MAG: DNA polymerase III subunit gamma/tau [Victivallaceae bacterium]|nr:DNA polymerase III subunit gamma/tau [Victivallaceae bacterium]
MSEYQVIARKWRPQRFSDVVGQEHVVKTLKNAIRQRRTAHAYLFVGPRGIGKTTTARIFAKALNCEAPEDGEPCCECKSCVSIADENNIDVIEIDAASQNSVDNIRDLREEVLHMPINCRYKIYIIDEVHMLSKSAWNALLKTVEEPPAHVKFIFATTEVHMVLPTIISRCQRFDLKPISSGLISDRLTEIAAAEKVKISHAAINAIARAADGGMRDAQSLLDQMIAFFSGDNKEISEEQVLSLFGLTGSGDLIKMTAAMFNNDRGGVIASIHSKAVKGKNLETLFSDILNYLRGVQLCQLLSNPEAVLESDPESIKRFRELGANVNPDVIQILMENLSSVGRVLHDAINKQVFLKTVLLKAMRAAHSVKISDLLARLNSLRKAGELKFLEQIPAAEKAPPKTIVEMVETLPEAPEPEAVPEAVPPEPELSFDPMPEPEPARDEFTPNSLWQQIIKFVKSDNVVDPTIIHYMNEGNPESFENSLLTVIFYEEFDSEHYAAVKKIMPSIHKGIQAITGDWAAAVDLIHKHGVRSIHKKVEHEIPEPEPEELALDSGVAGEVQEGAPEPDEDRVNSVIGDKAIVDEVKKKPIVSDSLDLFGGTIVDIHG